MWCFDSGHPFQTEELLLLLLQICSFCEASYLNPQLSPSQMLVKNLKSPIIFIVKISHLCFISYFEEKTVT